MKIPQKLRSSNKLLSQGNDTQPRVSFSSRRTQLLMVVVVFAALGSFFLFQSFAAELTVPSDQEIVLEFDSAHGMMPTAGAQIPAPDATVFRLYGNGLAVCGSSPYTPSGNFSHQTSQYRNKTLSPDEIRSLVTQVRDTGFLKLKADYTERPGVAQETQDTISLNLAQEGLTEVSVDQGMTATPLAFTQVTKLIKNLCSTFTTDYESDQTVVQTKEVAITPKTPVDQVEMPSDVQLPDSSTEVKSASKTGSTAKKVSSKLKHKPSSLVRANNKTYQVVVDQVLPTPAKPQKVKQQSMNRKGVVYAAAHPRIRFAEFCATDICFPSNTAAYSSNSQIWYTQQVTKTFDTDPNLATVRGSHPALYYLGCHKSSGCPLTLNPTCPANVACPLINDSMRNIIDNIYDEFGVPTSETTIFTIGFNVGLRSSCGITNRPNVYGPVPVYGIAAFSDPGAGQSCSSGNWDYKTVAHELGHAFGLDHTAGPPQSQGLMGTQYGCVWPACFLAAHQVAVLRDYSPYFYPPPKTVGRLDGSTCSNLRGWTLNTGLLSTALNVHAYFYPLNNTTVKGEGIPMGVTNVSRPDVNKVYGATGNHGYSVTVPAKWAEKPFTVQIYAIDNRSNPIIGTANVANCGVTGHIDVNNCTTVSGWAFDFTNVAANVRIDVYIKGVNDPGAGQPYPAGNVNIYRPDVNKVYSIGGNHGFSYTLPPAWKNKPHITTIYGVGPLYAKQLLSARAGCG